jgi:hypothetical protein
LCNSVALLGDRIALCDSFAALCSSGSLLCDSAGLLCDGVCLLGGWGSWYGRRTLLWGTRNKCCLLSRYLIGWLCDGWRKLFGGSDEWLCGWEGGNLV